MGHKFFCPQHCNYRIMGNVGSKDPFPGMKVLLIGLDSVGRGTILEKLELGEVTTEYIVLTMSVQRVAQGSTSFVSWYVGGSDKLRLLWSPFYEGVNGIAFVVDSTDVYRRDEAKKELHLMLGEKLLEGLPVLVFANKQDLPEAASGETIAEYLGLNEIEDRLWHVEPCIAVTGENLVSGLQWLYDHKGKILAPHRFGKTKSANARVE